MNITMNGSKYDRSMERSYNFYDSLPYVRDISVCGDDCIGVSSENVVKFFTYAEQNAIEVPNQDDVVFSQIRHHHQQQLLQAEAALADEGFETGTISA